MPATNMKMSKDKKDGAVKGDSKDKRDEKAGLKEIKKNKKPIGKPK